MSWPAPHCLAEPARTAGFSSERNAYFGDLHVHTMYSFDAFIFGTTSSPDDAYEFARGGSITHPAGFEMQLQVPLDFYGVTDHAFYIGVLREMANPDSEISTHPIAAGMSDLGGALETELNALMDNWLKEEVLYREALRLGLDQEEYSIVVESQ